jgi:hypothetical protein
MKKIFLLLITAIVLLGCKKNECITPDWFEIEIVNQKNMDCFNPEIIFVTRQQEAYQILGISLTNRYVALNLPKVLYPVGTRMQVAIHKPLAGESVVCTAMGPSYGQVYIDDIK